MKKTICFIVLALLCLNFSLNAQEQQALTALRIGDSVPEVTINNIINYPHNSSRTSDFRGKLLILDFWATWCSPCIDMIPVIDSLQKQFPSRVQFLEVAYQSQQEVELFMRKHTGKFQINCPVVMADTILQQLFPHRTLPHFVWIDGNGKVVQITDFTAINAVNIRKVLNGTNVPIRQKNDAPAIPHDTSKPFLVNGNGGDGSGLICHSVLSAYDPGLHSRMVYERFAATDPRNSHITCTNVNLQHLYRLAYSEGYRNFGDNKVIMEVRDTNQLTSAFHGEDYREWMQQGHAYCYELTQPSSRRISLYKKMQQDMVYFFPQYTASVEKRGHRCIALVRTSGADKLKSAGDTPVLELNDSGIKVRNLRLDQLVRRLDQYFQQNSPYPLVDHTGYTANADISIEANPGDLASINRGLEKYDLVFKEMDIPVDMLVISDTSH
ncbi:MAG: hypothetical protein JWQ66_2380 [Mucilaginibacter sp.]|nr:hypothetical protein [Mucilaginibacter sp.]